MLLSVVFSLICLGVAYTGFTSLGEIEDPGVLADAKGFAWFWTFLGSVAIAFGWLAWWLIRTQPKDEES